MIDRDELRIARRTAERNGYTVLPPREDDERDLDRFRQRQQEREEYRSSRPEYRRFRDEVDDEPVIRKPSFRDEKDAPKPRFRPLDTTDDADDDFDDNYVPAKKYTTRPVYREENDDDDVDDYVPPRKPVRQEIDLEVARKAMEDAGYEVRKLSRLDMAKRVAQDAGFDVRKITPTDRTKPVDRNFVRKERPTPTVADDDDGNDRPVRRVATRDGEPIRRPVFNREVVRQNRDAIRTRTAPDTEVKPQTPPPPQETQPKEPPVEPTPAPKAEPTKKPSFEDDYVNRAAAFFGDDE